MKTILLMLILTGIFSFINPMFVVASESINGNFRYAPPSLSIGSLPESSVLYTRYTLLPAHKLQVELSPGCFFVTPTTQGFDRVIPKKLTIKEAVFSTGDSHSSELVELDGDNDGRISKGISSRDRLSQGPTFYFKETPEVFLHCEHNRIAIHSHYGTAGGLVGNEFKDYKSINVWFESGRISSILIPGPSEFSSTPSLSKIVDLDTKFNGLPTNSSFIMKKSLDLVSKKNVLYFQKESLLFSSSSVENMFPYCKFEFFMSSNDDPSDLILNPGTELVFSGNSILDYIVPGLPSSKLEQEDRFTTKWLIKSTKNENTLYLLQCFSKKYEGEQPSLKEVLDSIGSYIRYGGSRAVKY